MAVNKTPNYDLNKPDYTEIADIPGHFNQNMDILDAALTPTADPTKTPTGNGPGKIVDWVSWLANRLKAITGKANWWESPTKSLEQLNTELTSHLADIASQEVGKGASLIGSSDSGNYYNSTNVEGQLQEIGARLSTFRNAVIREFTFSHPHQSGEKVVRLTGGIAGQVLITKPRTQQDTRQFLTALYAVVIAQGLPEIYEVYKIYAGWNVIPDSSNEGEILFTFPNPANSAYVHLLFIGTGNPVFEMVGDD